MLLTLTSSHTPATDLGYILAKHPGKVQSYETVGGRAHVFYPIATENICTAVMMLDINAVELVRSMKSGTAPSLSQYVNDRPYTANSLMSSAIAEVYGSALNGKCRDKPELVDIVIPLKIHLSAIRVKGDKGQMERLFLPLGYEIEAERLPLDPQFPEWGESNYFSLTLTANMTVQQALSHLYVLLPVLDKDKHYWVNKAEVEKLLAKGEGWLKTHPEKEWITRRYLFNVPNLVEKAFANLIADTDIEAEVEAEETTASTKEKERKITLHEQRLSAALEQLKLSGAKSVIDLGCGEGKLMRMLIKEGQFEKITGMDISFATLQRAKSRLYLNDASPAMRERISLFQGSLTYKDKRMEGYEAAALIEVIEHIDIERLSALEKVVFFYAKPKTVIVTTPNAEYNIKYESLSAGNFRHDDHRFEWTRTEFETWANQVATAYAYTVQFFPVGEIDPEVGAGSQMGVFHRNTTH